MCRKIKNALLRVQAPKPLLRIIAQQRTPILNLVKKFAALLPLALVALLITSSCNKCIKCQYTFTKNLRDSTVVFSQVCGNSTEVTNQENMVKGKAAADGAPEYSCTKD